MSLRTLQTTAWWITAIAAILALLAGTGNSPFPVGAPRLLPVAYLVVFAIAVAGGLLTAARHREIDRNRWQVVEDLSLTKGERQWAHEDAERERRLAGAAFLAASLLVAGWLAYQLGDPAGSLVADLLPMSALPAFGAGFAFGSWRARRT